MTGGGWPVGRGRTERLLPGRRGPPYFRRRRGAGREPGSPPMAVGRVWVAARVCRRGKVAIGLAGMATRAGAGAVVAGAAVVALLSAALALYGPPLDAGTWPQALVRTGGAAKSRGRRGGVGGAGPGPAGRRRWCRVSSASRTGSAGSAGRGDRAGPGAPRAARPRWARLGPGSHAGFTRMNPRGPSPGLGC